jgi:CheY-like chemotaxis protein
MSPAPRLLVVDDEPVVCRSCTKILEGQGYSVEATNDSRSALDLVATSEYAAILLDLKIPGMGGLEFLGEFRRLGRTTPVIVITGYPTIESAAAAMRLGAVDYVAKPFTPAEIVAAVTRMVQAPPPPTVRAVAPTPTPTPTHAPRPAMGPWSPTGPEVRFVGESWVAVGKDGTVRVGAFLSSAQLRATTAVVLPILGDTIQRGLPLAALQRSAGDREVLLAPISGEVIEVNDARARPVEATWGDPCGAGWLARVRPSHLEEDLAAAEVRHVMVASADELVLHKDRTQLTALGCHVTLAHTSAEAVSGLPSGGPTTLLIDAATLGDEGPKLVRAVLENLPSVRIMVVGEWRREHEAAYREQKIQFYTVKPFVKLELVDALHAAFTPPADRAAATPGQGKASRWIRRLRITNRAGRQVTLLADQGLLEERSGVGQQLIQGVLQGAYPLTIGLGNEPLTPARVSAEAGDSDRILVLCAKDLGRLPGTVTRDRPVEAVQQAGAAAQKVTTITVQSPATLEQGLSCGARLDAALASFLVREMTT